MTKGKVDLYILTKYTCTFSTVHLAAIIIVAIIFVGGILLQSFPEGENYGSVYPFYTPMEKNLLELQAANAVINRSMGMKCKILLSASARNVLNTTVVSMQVNL